MTVQRRRWGEASFSSLIFIKETFVFEWGIVADFALQSS
jgi:hypothetical protein